MPFDADLPVMPPLAPMLAKGIDAVPTGAEWLYEPKWDGFRAVVFRDGDAIHIASRDKKPMLRYFPELVDPLREALPERCVVDGELVILQGGAIAFGSLQMRLHPAESRVRKLASEIPAEIVLWDLLAVADESLLDVPFETRRARLEATVKPGGSVHLTPITSDPDEATGWFERFEGAGVDGVVAKTRSGLYEPGKRAMRKIKRDRTIDAVLCGFRWHKSGPVVGSLILGLFGEDGRLQQIGVASSFTAKRREELVAELAPLREGALDAHPWAEWHAPTTGRRPGVQSRWNAGRSLSWEPVRLERVVEVKVNQVTDGRLRHPAKFLRWRPDRTPESCRFAQLEPSPPEDLQRLLGG